MRAPFGTRVLVLMGLVTLTALPAVGCRRPDAGPGSEQGDTIANLSDTNVNAKCLGRLNDLNSKAQYNKPDGSRFLADETRRFKLCDFTAAKGPMSTAPVDCYKKAIKENPDEAAAVEKCKPK